jgi:hypothetical protein
MSDSPVRRLRGRLLDLKRSEPDKARRIEIAECLADLDEIERKAPADDLERWREIHAPNWRGTEMQREILKLFLALGDDGVSRDDVAAIMGDEDSDRSSASIGKVRSALSRIRQSLKQAGSTATIEDAGRDGVYRTHDPMIQTFGEVSQKRHR